MACLAATRDRCGDAFAAALSRGRRGADRYGGGRAHSSADGQGAHVYVRAKNKAEAKQEERRQHGASRSATPGPLPLDPRGGGWSRCDGLNLVAGGLAQRLDGAGAAEAAGGDDPVQRDERGRFRQVAVAAEEVPPAPPPAE